MHCTMYLGRSPYTQPLANRRYKNKVHGMDMKELAEILACPQCKGPVKLVNEEKGLLCEKCGLLYEIKEGIPVMLVGEAQKVTQ